MATRAPTIRAMCDLAKLKPDDRVLDLGCGDGSIVITAAREYGAFGIGVELNPLLAAYARFKMRRAGVQDRVRIIQGNMYDVELPDVDCVMLYLLPKGNGTRGASTQKALSASSRHLSRLSITRNVGAFAQHARQSDGKAI